MNPFNALVALPKRETYTHVAVLLALAAGAAAALFAFQSFAAPIIPQTVQTESLQ